MAIYLFTHMQVTSYSLRVSKTKSRHLATLVRAEFDALSFADPPLIASLYLVVVLKTVMPF